VKKSVLPLSSADKAKAGYTNAEGRVQEPAQAEKAGEESREWVAGRRDGVAALHRPSVALVDRRDCRRGEATITPSHRGGSSSSSTARYSEAYDQRYNGLVEHHCEE
jgi:hypothetical protein